MAFGWTKTRYSPIAVDFGADSLKLLQVVLGEPPSIVAAAAAVVPEHARNDPAARYAFFADALKRLTRTQPFKGRRAICSIPSYQTLLQHLPVARSEQDDIDAQVRQQLRQRFNINPSRMVVRAFPVHQATREGGAKQEVICLAVGRESVMRHIEMANRCKLDVVGMQSEPLAVIRAFEHLYRRKADVDRTTCFIDIGAATTKVVIAHGKEMAFAKTIHAAGDHLTRHLAGMAHIGFIEAREARIQKAKAMAPTAAAASSAPGEVSAGRGRSPGVAAVDDEGHDAAPVAVAAAPVHRPMPDPTADGPDTIDCLIDELHMCVRYHQSMFKDRPIEKLVFLGGESRHVSTCRKVARALRIGAQLGDPLARLTRISQGRPPEGVDLREPQPGWAVPLGLCLSEANL
jgi:type IV pilus assembly protein PilM